MVKELICSIALVGALGVSTARPPIQDWQYNYQDVVKGGNFDTYDYFVSFGYSGTGQQLQDYLQQDVNVLPYKVVNGVTTQYSCLLDVKRGTDLTNDYFYRVYAPFNYSLDNHIHMGDISTWFISFRSDYQYLHLYELGDFNATFTLYLVHSSGDYMYYSENLNILTEDVLNDVTFYTLSCDSTNWYWTTDYSAYAAYAIEEFDVVAWTFTIKYMNLIDLVDEDAIYENGYNQGYSTGFDNGVNSSNSAVKLFTLIADVPIYYLKSLFNFSFFGIPMYTLVLGVITLLVLLFVIKKVI